MKKRKEDSGGEKRKKRSQELENALEGEEQEYRYYRAECGVGRYGKVERFPPDVRLCWVSLGVRRTYLLHRGAVCVNKDYRQLSCWPALCLFMRFDFGLPPVCWSVQVWEEMRSAMLTLAVRAGIEIYCCR